MSKENQVIAPVLGTQPDNIDEIKQHADILEVLSEYVVLKKRGQEYVGLCPFHEEKTPSFSVNPTKQLYYCYGCAAGGDTIQFLMEHLSLKFADAVEHLAQQFSIPVAHTRGNHRQLRALSDSLPHQPPQKPKVVVEAKPNRQKELTVDEAYVRRSHERLFHTGEIQSQALAWLTGTARNFSHDMIAHYRLGLESVHYKNDDSGQWEDWWGIAIFIPVPGRPGRYYKKVRVAPWVVGDARPSYIKDWYQKGVPATVWAIYNPPGATQTWYTEGEWDGMTLGYLANCQDEKVAVACSTGGCGTVPPLDQLKPLPCPLFTFFDRNDGLNKQGVRPGDEGARKLVEVLLGGSFIAQVPMPDDCEIKGWDVSDSLGNGYGIEDFRAAAERAYQAHTSSGESEARTENGGKGGTTGRNLGGRRPNRREIKGFCQKAFDDLYGDKHWLWVFNHLYYWNENYYEAVDTNAEISRINQYCDTKEAVKEVRAPETGEVIEEIVTYPYARPRYVNEVFSWVTQKLSIDSKRVNPPGLNCLDGVLELSYDPDSQKWQRHLAPHDPKKHLYLYPPQATYNIPAVVKPDACDQLLSCLDAPQREIFLKIVAASLDLNTVRIYKGREIRALLMLGLGNNGKDTLRETTAMMFGYRGMVGASLSDFKQYDEGRKFPLAKLDGALINWPSENADCMLLDRLQSIKIAITGEPLSAEKKGRDEYQFNSKCTHFFNVNSLPHLLGASEAIVSRFTILNFTKTYKSHPGPGELKADPRFLYDKEFVRTEVLPWYLHRVLDALDRLMVEGIDYSCTSTAFEKAREEGDHVYSFCKEVGIGYLPNATITATEAYEQLRQWYIANGTLEVKDLGDGRTKDIWNTQTTWGDHTVKGLNQILPRLLKLFPKATRTRDRLGRNCLEGIGFLPKSGSGGGGGDSGGDGQPQNSPYGNSVSQHNNSEAVLNVSEAVLNHSYPSHSNGFEAPEADPAISRVKNLWTVLTEEERSQLLKEWGVEKNSGVMSNSQLPIRGFSQLVTHPKNGDGLESKEFPRSLSLQRDGHVPSLIANCELRIANCSVNHSNQLQLVQNPDTASDTVSSGDVQTASAQVQNPPTAQELARQILLCSSWVAAANICQCDGAKLKAAVQSMKDDEQQHLTVLMAQHLVQTGCEQLATELAALLLWLPETLKEQLLGALRFTVTQINPDAPVGLDDAPLTIKVEGCYLVECRIENCGRKRQSTDFYFHAPCGALLKSSEGWFELTAALGSIS